VIPRPIRRLLRHTAVSLLALREARRADPARIIWLLGHMRSGSTLLMHLLSSHPEILGAGERNATYSTSDDLHRLVVDAAYQRREFFRRYGYVVDQINHSRFLASEELLDHPRLYRIFLVREPTASLASMNETFGPLYDTSPGELVEYYLERLPALERDARQASNRSRSLFLTYEELVGRPAETLSCLAAFLDLRSPLSERYELFDFTGKKGDPSSRISSRQILPDRPRGSTALAPAVEQRLQAAHSRCLRVLRDRCETPATIGSPTGAGGEPA